MVVAIDFPTFKQSDQNFWLETSSTTFGRGLDGDEQIVTTENRRWVGRVTFGSETLQQVLRLRALGDSLRGRANEISLELFNVGTVIFGGSLNQFYLNMGLLQVDIDAGQLPFSDGNTFNDGNGFALPISDEPIVDVDAPVGATSLEISNPIGGRLAVGAMFSDEVDYMYRVETNNGDGIITFNPPLRRAISAGDTINVSIVRILVRLASDTDFRSFMDGSRISKSLAVNFTEILQRA